jgi:HSP20 family protein
MSVLRFDPFGEMDRLAEQLRGGRAGGGARSFPMDAYRRGERFFVHFDLPGFRADSIEVDHEQNVLTVRADRRFERHEGDEVVVMERPQGSFTRQLFLSEALDPERITASYQDGVLTLEIPVAERARPRRIQISSPTDEPQTIEASATRAHEQSPGGGQPEPRTS